MKALRILFPVLIIASLSGCGPKGPTADELKAKFVGIYCKDHNKLEVREDGTYKCRRSMRGFATGKPISERCSGVYSFEYDDTKSEWNIVFAPSTENSNPLILCQGSQVIWTKEKAYGASENVPILKELFEGIEVTPGNCD